MKIERKDVPDLLIEHTRDHLLVRQGRLGAPGSAVVIIPIWDVPKFLSALVLEFDRYLSEGGHE